MADSNVYDPAPILTRLQNLIHEPHVSPDYIRFRVGVLEAQAAARAALGPGAATDTLPLDPALMTLDAGTLRSLYAALRASVGGQGLQSVELDRLGVIAGQHATLLDELARGALLADDVAALSLAAERIGVSVEALQFVGRVLVAPFVLEAATKPAVDLQQAPPVEDSGTCARCDSAPALAVRIGEEGRRVLCCSLCGRRWTFARLACPHCGNRDQQRLATLAVGENEPRWIEVCDACGQYVKTTDARRLSEGAALVALVEDTATLHLDLLAEKEGYRRRPPYAALV
ncbi:MAG: formate dehydrogenase accessory protein FdhE [Phycisphaerae bacterium]|nr:formate dehydrogenase accessory protein FdhE [Phycisphaerae bacterium]